MRKLSAWQWAMVLSALVVGVILVQVALNRPASQIARPDNATQLPPTPTRVLESPTATPRPTLTPTPAPFRFVFPTQQAPPVSAWRPPLYEVPWSPTENDHFYFIRPIGADEINWPDKNYRYGGIFFEGTVHTGVDIAAEEGAPVVAAGGGKVIWSGWGLYSGIEDRENDPYGISVVIRHDFGYEGKQLYTVYGHLSRVDVVRGQYVETGQQIGNVGKTGFTTGPHLHFEVRIGENNFFTTQNPELWTAPPQGWGVLVGRVMGTGGQLLERHPVIVRNKATKRIWTVISYGSNAGLNSDAYYRENLAMGDVPAGVYELETDYLGRRYTTDIEIQPGLVTYFTYRGRDGFFLDPPASPASTELPPWENGE